MYDIIVVGAGPAGLTAAIYALRAGKSVLIIEKSTFGGQITHSPKVENYPGFVSMSGTEFADRLVEQALGQGAEIELDEVIGISGTSGDFTVKTEGDEYEAKAVILATGSHHRKLGLPRENDFTGEGISYCAVCDGAFYKDKNVAIVGGGNTALQEAVMLSDIAAKVFVVQNLDFLTGEQKLIDEISSKANIEIVLSSTVAEILADGDSFKGILLQIGDKTQELLVDGVFVAIGQKPENEPFKDIVALNEYGYIKADESCLPESKASGIFVCGDCRTKTVRQITTATADGAVAAIAACKFIDSI